MAVLVTLYNIQLLLPFSYLRYAAYALMVVYRCCSNNIVRSTSPDVYAPRRVNAIKLATLTFPFITTATT